MKTLILILLAVFLGWTAGFVTAAIIDKTSIPKSYSKGTRVSVTMDDVLVIYENGWVRGEKSGLLNRDTWEQDSAFITETLWGSFHEDNKIFLNNKRVD